jgi:hypothetical protein
MVSCGALLVILQVTCGCHLLMTRILTSRFHGKHRCTVHYCYSLLVLYCSSSIEFCRLDFLIGGGRGILFCCKKKKDSFEDPSHHVNAHHNASSGFLLVNAVLILRITIQHLVMWYYYLPMKIQNPKLGLFLEKTVVTNCWFFVYTKKTIYSFANCFSSCCC